MPRQLSALLLVIALAHTLRADKPSEEGFVSLFDGKELKGWTGDLKGHPIENGVIVCRGKNLYTEKEYANFVFRFEFTVPPGGNNGVGLRAPLQGDPAYVGMESQILDDNAAQYKNLKPYQYHGSIYGVAPAKRGHLKPTGEWNEQEITCNGSQVSVKLNGVLIVDVDIAKYRDGGTPDGQPHPGLKRTSGHIVLLGHGSPVQFRNLRIKELP
jgi:hypothetical protein